MRRFLLCGISMIWLSCSASFQLHAPDKTPVPNDEAVEALIREGIRLHDEHRFDEAVDCYARALTLNPENPAALYEMSYAYFAKGDYKKSMLYAAKAAEYESDLIGPVYTQIGTLLDIEGKPRDAVAVYEKALERDPVNYLLQYNLGITCIGLKQNRKAMACFKKAMLANPAHAGSHLALGEMYLNDGYRIPCIMAYSRFLMLEPNTQRAANTLMKFQNVLTWGVTQKSENNIDIDVPMRGPDYDGDFSSLNLTLSLISAARFTEENRNKAPVEHIVSSMKSLIEMMAGTAAEGECKGFVWEYYAPYFVEMNEKGLVEPFVYYIFQIADDEGVQMWIHEHGDELVRFQKWIREMED
ncbi:tetratricopeptide repeat protein [bacterium]|nr:tetratricopeptide repeat protein [bacterium]